ncbi:MAG: hypothetical protein AAB623_00535 [Patescibacteria group bacterium]
MNKFLEWVTKKRMIFSSVVMIIIYVISYFNRILELPSFYRDFCCIDDKRVNLFLIFIPIFIFTIIFSILSETKFNVWKKFTFIYLFIYLFIYFIVPTQGNGFIWFQRETISFFGSIIYSTISLFLIIYKSFKKE